MGYPHPDFLLPLLSARQLREWQWYNQVEPFGQPEHDLQAAFTRKTVADSGMVQKKDGSEFTLREMSMNDMRAEHERKQRMGGKLVQKSRDIVSLFKMAFGAEDKREKKNKKAE